MTLRNPKKNLRKESCQRTSGTTRWDKLGQVEVVGQVGQGEGCLQILVGQVEQLEGGLQIFLRQVGQGQGFGPLEPFHLSQMELQRIFPPYSQHFTTPQISFEFSGFYYTSNIFFIKTNQHKRLENLLFSRNLVLAERKRRGQGGVMWTKDHTRSDANYIAWINLIQSNTTHCAELGLMRAQKSYIDASSAQVTALLGSFSFAV